MERHQDPPDLPFQVKSERTHLRLPSLPHWIEPTVEFLRHKAVLSGACHDARSDKLMLALHEALANSIIHGNLGVSSDLKERGDDAFAQALAERCADARLAGRAVDIEVDYDGIRCRWSITDEGRGFNVDKVLERCLSDDPEVMLASGRGILIMRSLMDEVRYENAGRRIVLTLTRGSGEEKRGDERRPVHEPLRVAPIRSDGSVDWDAAYEAVSRNLSDNGIAIVQEGLQSCHRVLIGIAAGNQTVYLPAEVRHFRKVSQGLMEIGCQFQTDVKPFSDDKVQPEVNTSVDEAVAMLLEREHDLPDEERRAHPRVVFNSRLTVLPLGSTHALEAFSRDLSKGGVSFIATTPVPDEVSIVFYPRAAGKPLRLRCSVMRCNHITDNFYDVGARFLYVENE